MSPTLLVSYATRTRVSLEIVDELRAKGRTEYEIWRAFDWGFTSYVTDEDFESWYVKTLRSFVDMNMDFVVLFIKPINKNVGNDIAEILQLTYHKG